ncbi:MAG TPA: peptide-methionine (S)-S-oxide reductase MsrA [Gemmata sp.]|nr:peptide-methionine (S)-S-oxide reductase MsrA [Gemmata sp.]
MIASIWKFMKRIKVLLVFLVAVIGGLVAIHYLPGKAQPQEYFPTPDPVEIETGAQARANDLETATFGSGCFWCTEAVFQQLKGVQAVMSGYSGGSVENPTYQEICTGMTGHAEVIQVTFDPKVVSYQELLEVFWRTHDPTTLNRQGNDVGTQYRSVIFYHSDRQRQLAERYREKIDAAHVFSKPLVTEIAPFTTFYAAEDYHQNYYTNHTQQPYCRSIIGPKIDKLRKVFQEKLK